MSGAYYNEIDMRAAATLRELVRCGHIAAGDVDTRSIEDVKPDDLRGYTQCHFFAGIGVWSYALRLAGWPDDRQVWTGSCPCQPFSAAGQGAGFDDERHLWPAWFQLIAQRRPIDVFGEQVASKDGLAWLDLVHADMEAAGYAFGAFDLCAASVGAPHIRQRLFFAARALDHAHGWSAGDGLRAGRPVHGVPSHAGGLADSSSTGLPTRQCGALVGTGRGLEGRTVEQRGGAPDAAPATGADHSPWANPDWLFCRDGRWRPVEAGTFPLAHGAPARVGLLRGYGNAIVAPLAATFIESYKELIDQA